MFIDTELHNKAILIDFSTLVKRHSFANVFFFCKTCNKEIMHVHIYYWLIGDFK